MGNVRDKNIKKFSKQLIEEYPDKVSTDFNINKQLLKDLKCINSKIVRNRVAGYIVQCLKTKDNTYENIQKEKSLDKKKKWGQKRYGYKY